MAVKHNTQYDPYRDAEERDILIFETPISQIKGYYQRTVSYTAILVDSGLTTAEKRSVLAHELAHDRYSAGPIKEPKTLRERLYYQQHEKFIDKKAAESLMPVHAVYSFLEKNPEACIYDLAEFFNVSEHLAHVRIDTLLNEGLL